jgi:hypothetical protein
MYTSSEAMQTFVDVHLVVDAFDRQFNTWRNIARLFARTDYVMMLDIDFYLCTDFRSVIRQSFAISSQLRDGRAALVVPAFEYVDNHEGTNYANFPRKKSVCTLPKLPQTIQVDQGLGASFSRKSPSCWHVSCILGPGA